MERPRILPADDPAGLAAAVQAIHAGEMVAVPTETVYGLACASRDDALARLVAAKGRPAEKGITLLVDGLEMAQAVGDLSFLARRLAERYWPGPLTLVVPLQEGLALPALVTGGGRRVGLRVPDMGITRALATECGPLSLTSANRSGEPEARSVADVVAVFDGSVALVLDGGPSPGGVPSTVVDVGPGDRGRKGRRRPWRILRVGAVSEADIEAALRA